jgi:hypothetical protein
MDTGSEAGMTAGFFHLPPSSPQKNGAQIGVK